MMCKSGTFSYKNSSHRPLLTSNVFGSIGQKSEMTRPLDGQSQAPLVLGAGPNFAAWSDLTAVGEKTPQIVHLFVIDMIDLVHAEVTDLTT